jgi:mitochondrial fission protein ELM1
LSKADSAPLAPPWPDLVISTGRRTAPVARWIGQQTSGRTRLVQLGRRGGESVDAFDLVVSCAHFRLPLHPRRLEITAPLNAVTPERLARAADRWHGLFAAAPRPHIVVVAGGTCARYRFDAETARRMGEEVRTFAASVGGSVFAITSPRTGAEATAALRLGLGESGRLHEWRRGETDNPYMGYLALADAIVVTGESESMLAETVAAAKPLFIYALPERPLGFRRLAEWVASRAEARPRKAKGTVRPQQGLEYLCARLIAAGLVRPPRHLDQLHAGLVRHGAARYFRAPFDMRPCQPLRDVDEVARRVRLLLGYGAALPADRNDRGAFPTAGDQIAPSVTALRRERSTTSVAAESGDRRVGAARS